MKNTKAIFPGSFDPITVGHVDVIKSSLLLFKNITIAIGVNKQKKCMFDIEDRINMIESVFEQESRIVIKKYTGLTIDFCKKEKIKYIIRGLRNHTDFDYEQSIVLANQELDNNIETIFMPAKKEHIFISSTVIREIILNSKDLKTQLNYFVPKKIISKINTIRDTKSTKKI